MTLRVLLIDDQPERAAKIEPALRAVGCAVVAHVSGPMDLTARVRELHPDVIIIDRDSPDRDTLEHICMVTRDEPHPIVMFSDDGDPVAIRAAVDAGVSAYVVGGFTTERIRPIVEAAMARFEQLQAMRQELAQAKTTLAERKQIERAKGIVMRQSCCNEEAAYHRLRRLAMERSRRLADVARDVIEMSKLLA